MIFTALFSKFLRRAAALAGESSGVPGTPWPPVIAVVDIHLARQSIQRPAPSTLQGRILGPWGALVPLHGVVADFCTRGDPVHGVALIGEFNPAGAKINFQHQASRPVQAPPI